MNRPRIPRTRIIISLLIGAWLYVWVHTLVLRPVINKKQDEKYAKYAFKTYEEKVRNLIGEDLYNYIKFCQANLPERSLYRFVGMDPEDLAHRRAAYYLLPHKTYLPEKDGEVDFLLVFNQPPPAQDDYVMYRSLNSCQYILKRKGQ